MGGETTNANDLKETSVVPLKENDTFIITFHCKFGDNSVKIIKDIDTARKEKVITDGQYLTLIELRERLKPEFEKLNAQLKDASEGFTANIGKYSENILSREPMPLILSTLALAILGYIVFFHKQK